VMTPRMRPSRSFDNPPLLIVCCPQSFTDISCCSFYHNGEAPISLQLLPWSTASYITGSVA
ncbi:hypothetical protein K0U00_45550, partial [Paenibacillus sepulcri]|nr:hypothetical protein [Paenibacillus sepulcri]